MVFTQLSRTDDVLYLDIPRLDFPVNDLAYGYSHIGEAYKDGFDQDVEAYGFASWVRWA